MQNVAQALDIHRLYNGALAKPVPATLAHFASIAMLLAIVGSGASARATVPLFVAGFMAWTLFEYGLHRWLLHSKNPVLWRVLHKEHHAMRRMQDPNHRVMHPIVAVPMMAGATLLFVCAGAPPLLGIGFWVGYLAYELIHWVHHDARLTKRLSRFAYFSRRVVFHHDHHFRRANTHYGFTVGLWDHVFGTASNTSRFAEVRQKVVAAESSDRRQ